MVYFHELTNYLLKLSNKNDLLDPFVTPIKEIKEYLQYWENNPRINISHFEAGKIILFF